MNAGVPTTLDHARHNWSPEHAYAGLNATADSGARVFWAYSFQSSENYAVSQQLSVFREMAESIIIRPSNVEIDVSYYGFRPVDPEEVASVASIVRQYNRSVLTTHTSGGIFGGDNMPEDVDAFDLLNNTSPFIFSCNIQRAVSIVDSLLYSAIVYLSNLLSRERLEHPTTQSELRNYIVV